MMGFIIAAIVIVILATVIIWIEYTSKSMIRMGFVKKKDRFELLAGFWELKGFCGRISKIYSNKSGIYLAPTTQGATMYGSLLPAYILSYQGVTFRGHCLSLTDMLAPHSRFGVKLEGEKQVPYDLNVYSYGEETTTTDVATFINFVERYRKSASIEIKKNQIIVLISITELSDGLEIIESAKAAFGSANESSPTL
jgi:hypothetical protein